MHASGDSWSDSYTGKSLVAGKVICQKCGRRSILCACRVERVLLRPSCLGERWELGRDLHMGIAIDVAGRTIIYSFSDAGITAEPMHRWREAICVLELTVSARDDMLENFILNGLDSFNVNTYSEREWNCFDFVIEYLQRRGNLTRPEKRTKVKELFVELYVLDALIKHRAMSCG